MTISSSKVSGFILFGSFPRLIIGSLNISECFFAFEVCSFLDSGEVLCFLLGLFFTEVIGLATFGGTGTSFNIFLSLDSFCTDL